MDFNYNKKDSYTQQDIENILEQHGKYARKGHVQVTPEMENDLNELKTHKVNKYKQEVVDKHFSKYNIKPELHDKVFKLADINYGEEDEVVKTKIKSFAKDESNRVFFSQVDTDTDSEASDNLPPVRPKTNVGGGSFWKK